MTHIMLSGDAVAIDAVGGFVAPYESAPDDLLLVAGVLGCRLIDLRLERQRRGDVPRNGQSVVPGVADPLSVVRLGRAIGVIYLPATERQSHYFHTRPADQFDAIIHINQTRALEPLEATSLWVAGENPETYPTGL